MLLRCWPAGWLLLRILVSVRPAASRRVIGAACPCLLLPALLLLVACCTAVLPGPPKIDFVDCVGIFCGACMYVGGVGRSEKFGRCMEIPAKS
jgi:hypothetical protein